MWQLRWHIECYHGRDDLVLRLMRQNRLTCIADVALELARCNIVLTLGGILRGSRVAYMDQGLARCGRHMGQQSNL